MTMMQQMTLARRPEGAPTQADFNLETCPIPTPGASEVLVEVSHFSLDPYMRGRMDAAKSYAASVPIGGVMEAGGVGRVIASNDARFGVGDQVFGMFGWASHGVVKGGALRKLDDALPATTALGVLGMPGFTGWYGLTQRGLPQAGETLVVAAATGPVGSMVGQLARRAGLRVVGIAGGADKCAMARDEFGFDACIDHRAHDTARDLRTALADACPDGVDIYFENVAGKTLQAIIPLMNVHGRIPLCGMVSWYNEGALGAGASTGDSDMLPWLWRNLLVSRLTVSGFIISDHFDQFPTFLREVAPLVAAGDVKYIEDIAQGLENAPAAFAAMLKGGNRGKQIVAI